MTEQMELVSRETVLEQQAMSWPDKARAFVITTQETLELAANALKGIKGLRAEIEEVFGPNIKRWFDGHRAAVAERKKVEEPLTEAESIIKRNISGYQQEQERIRQEEERRLRLVAEEAARQQRARELADLEATKPTVEEYVAVAERPLEVAPIYAAPTVQKVQGVSSRESWKAEVTDLGALIGFVAQNRQYVNLLEANTTAVNAMARSLKSAMSIPGIKVYNEAVVSVRR
jgi:hypothetical protein